MFYVETALLIVAVGIVLFILHICTCMNNWRQYIQELEEHENTTTISKCVLHKDCAVNNNNPPSYSESNSCVVNIDLPPKYEEAMKNQNSENTQQQILSVETLPAVYIIPTDSSKEQPIKIV